MDYRWPMALSIIGILLGIADFVLNSIFNLYGCFCPASEVSCVCQAPFSYYLYTYYIPFAIIAVSVAGLILSLWLRKTKSFQEPTRLAVLMSRTLHPLRLPYEA